MIRGAAVAQLEAVLASGNLSDLLASFDLEPPENEWERGYLTALQDLQFLSAAKVAVRVMQVTQ